MTRTTKFSHKIMAMFLTLTFLPSLFPINLVFASNGGPTAPEATSFEPVDASDIVNLATGDLSYVMPLLSVPSPEGGYPLALSYHAGIAMDQEASWVGLGWSLTPGAINRSVSGLPDDWKEGTKADVIYGIGGEAKQRSFSANVGWGKGVFSAGLYFSESSNKAFGGERTYSYSSDFGVSGSAFGAGGYAGTNGVGISGGTKGASGYIGTNGVGVSYDVTKAITNVSGTQTGNQQLFTISANTNFKTGSASASISKKITNGSLGITLGNNYGSISVGQGSISLYGANSLSTDINLQITGSMIMIPFYNIASIDYSSRKTRYWLYDRIGYDGIGSLYPDNLQSRNNSDALPFTNSFDSYESTYEVNRANQFQTSNYAQVSYDSYIVNGQGITGEMAPKIFESGVLKHKYQKVNLSSIDDKFTGVEFKQPQNNFQKSISDPNNGVHFYFENFNASYLRLENDQWNIISTFNSNLGEYLPNSSLNAVSPQGKSNYNSNLKQAYKGNFVESFTNKELNENLPNGFIDTNSKGFNRSQFVSQKTNDGIGAFQVTTIDGKTYHYSLPVYQKEQFSRSSELDLNINEDFYEEQTLDHYATHWLLTAVTGPDYIDVNNNHLVDDLDYGYWVNFEYGKWSDGFSWRNPVGNTDFVESEKSKSYQWGIKEVYYLNKIKTRTHSAFFIKEEREDAKSSEIRIGQSRTNMKRYTSIAYGSNEQNIIFGKDGYYYLKGAYQNLILGDPVSAVKAVATIDDDYYVSTNQHKSLRLNKVLLFKNEDVPSDLETPNPNETTGSLKAEIYIKEDINGYYQGESQEFSVDTKTIKDVQYSGEYYNNVLDVNDVDLSAIENQSSDVFDFGYEYSLFKNVPNSSSGKLTLKALSNKGKNGATLIPPYKFEYMPADYSRDIDDWGYNQFAQAGSLSKIKTPTGADINITYEEDDYHNEIIPTRRVFNSKLQFDVSVVNNKLRILVEDEQGGDGNISFNEFFEIGKADFDFWACYIRDFFAGGCQSRHGTIDVKNEEVDIIAVDANSVLLETSLSNTSDSNGGLNELLSNSPFGLEYHPGMIYVNKFRGECENPDGCINVTPRLVLDYFLYGNKDLRDRDGGGVRVKQITTTDDNGEIYSTNYYYNNMDFDKNKLDSNYRSSGVTSFAPSKYVKEVKYINELPSPYVIYEYVTLEKKGNGKFTGKVQYQFKVLKNLVESANEFSIDDILKISKVQNGSSPLTNSSGFTINANFDKYVLVDNLASIGSLLKVKTFNEFDQIMKIIENGYKTNATKNQGIMEESFITSKLFIKKLTEQAGGGGTYDRTINYSSSSKISYPNVLGSIKMVQGGITTTTYNDVFDFNTGQVLETSMMNSENRGVRTKIVPAYSEYAAMGTKVDNPSNRNMLAQQRAVYSYIDINGSWKETGVGITTWKPWENDIWRKHKNYNWNGNTNPDGTLSGFNDDFDWSLAANTQAQNWLLQSETTKYNEFSMQLETRDINNNRIATKMNNPNDKIIATGNAGYDQIFFSGAEDLYLGVQEFGGGVAKGNATLTQDILDAHTGQYALLVNSGQTAYEVTVDNGNDPAQDYKISLWAKASNGYYENTRVMVGSEVVQYRPEEVVRAGDWVLLNFYKSINGTAQIHVTSSGGSTIVDDFRVHPVAATMSSYVYNQWDELTDILGANNLSTKFDYDSEGRLKKTYTEVGDYSTAGSGGFKRTGENEYTYKY